MTGEINKIRRTTRRRRKPEYIYTPPITPFLILGCLALLAWFIFSIAEVWSHSAAAVDGQIYEYSAFNMFRMFMMS